MTFEEWLRDIPEDWEPEPFCYFIPAYCDVAYDFEKCEKEIVYLGALLHDVDDIKLVGEQQEKYIKVTLKL